MKDRDIVKLLLERKEEALNLIKDKYGALSRSVSRNILKNEEDSLECFNDALLKVWQSIPPARPDNLQAYFIRIVRNLSVDRLKHREAKKRNTTCAPFEELENLLYSDGSLSDGLELEDLQKAINRFLGIYLFMYSDYYSELSYTLDHTFAGSLTMTGISVGGGHRKIVYHVYKEEYTIENAVELCGTFENCSNMTWVSIGARVTKIDGDTFKGCTSLEKISYCGTLEEWRELSEEWIDIPELDGVEITIGMPFGEKQVYVRDENGDYVLIRSYVE